MRLLLLVLPLFLCGCSAITDAITPDYQPEPIRIYDAARYQADVDECRAAGLTYKATPSLRGVIVETVNGATSNSSLIPVSPLVPVYGAAGGAVSAASNAFDFASRQHANVFRHCLKDETARDGSAILADPND